MTIGREGCGIAVLDNEIYIVGGWTKHLAVNNTGEKTVEAFCPLTGKWRTCAPLIEPRHWVSVSTISNIYYVHTCVNIIIWVLMSSLFDKATSVGEKIYVLGGRKEANPRSDKYKSVECYDKKTDSWTFIADMNSSRYGVSAGSLGNDLVIVGEYITSNIFYFD